MLLKYKFKDESLFKLAMTQSGVDSAHNNEKLEFLGDRVLGLSVSALVSTETLADVAIKLELEKSLHHGHITGGRKRHMLANTMEALLGAMFLDSDFNTARAFICDIWHDLAAAEIEAPKDSKTKLQEFVQKHANGLLPSYEYTDATGAPHCPTFTVTVTAMGQKATGHGSSKKDASTAAADALLKKLAI